MDAHRVKAAPLNSFRSVALVRPVHVSSVFARMRHAYAGIDLMEPGG